MDPGKKDIIKRIGFFFFDTLRDVKSSSSESSDDEEPKRKIAKVEKYIETTVRSYDEKQFKMHFRMNRHTLYMLVGRFENSAYKAKNECGEFPISSEKSLMLSIWYLGNTETFRQTCDRFGISISSAHRVLIRILDFYLSLKEEHIIWPNEERKKGISDNFTTKHHIRNVIGAIDGSHVKINRPSVNEESYVNRKGYHSLLIQAVSDHSKLFTDVSCGEPGSLHDARVLRRSGLYRRAQNANYFGKYFLIGDSAYPALNWLVPPFKDNGHLTENEKLFNYRLSSSRMVIEHAFGLLKGRFRRLHHLYNLDIRTCVKIIISCCILHNICIMYKDDTEVSVDTRMADLKCNIESSINMPLDQIGVNRRNVVFQEMFAN